MARQSANAMNPLLQALLKQWKIQVIDRCFTVFKEEGMASHGCFVFNISAWCENHLDPRIRGDPVSWNERRKRIEGLKSLQNIGV